MGVDEHRIVDEAEAGSQIDIALAETVRAQREERKYRDQVPAIEIGQQQHQQEDRLRRCHLGWPSLPDRRRNQKGEQDKCGRESVAQVGSGVFRHDLETRPAANDIGVPPPLRFLFLSVLLGKREERDVIHLLRLLQPGAQAIDQFSVPPVRGTEDHHGECRQSGGQARPLPAPAFLQRYHDKQRHKSHGVELHERGKGQERPGER